MSQKTLSKWMKIIIVMLGVCGAVLYGVVVPVIGTTLSTKYPEFAYCFLPWFLFLIVTALPCYMVLMLGWKIATSIKSDESFTNANAKRLKYVSVLALATSIYEFIGNVVFLLLNMNPFPALLASLLIVFIGISISVAAAVLSHLVAKAAQLQEQSDLTI